MWEYKTKIINSHADLIPACTDIVYLLTYESGKKYIGKKAVRSMRRLKPTKAQLKIRKNYKRVELKELAFINYEGSSLETDGEIVVHKEILYQCSTRKAATYIECAMLFGENAVFEEEYLNLNISGTFFDNDLNGLLDNEEENEPENIDNSELEHLRSEVDRLSRLEFPDNTGK